MENTFPLELVLGDKKAQKESFIHNCLSKVWPEEMDQDLGFSEKFLKKLPLIKYLESDEKNLKVYAFFSYKKHAGKFLFDFLTNYILPKKTVKVSQFFSCNCKLKKYENLEFTACEVELEFDSVWEKDCAYNNLSMCFKEIMIGLSSIFKAQRILEMQGESNHEKLAHVQELLNTLITKFPLLFDYDVFTLMQQVFIDLKESFKIVRETRYLVRMITTLYMLQKELIESLDSAPDKRHVFARFKQTKLQMPLGLRPVLGIFVGLNFLRENEIFSKKQLFKAVQSVMGDVFIVEDSFLEIEDEDDLGRFFYLEVEKISKQPFRAAEIALLNQRLPSRLVGRIEHLQRPIFMPRNEEEVMKNIVMLSGQLKYVKDLPQVIISFEEQTFKSLTFTVILVRILHDNCQNANLLLKMLNASLNVSIERERKLGKLRQRYDKEALVMKVSIESLMFLREDDSIDLYKARQFVLKEFEKVFGHVRDFNGGMISKQAESLYKLKNLLGHVAADNRLLLENFFHSIYPIEMRSVVSSLPLKELFLLLLNVLNHKSEGRGFKEVCKQTKGFDVYLIEFHDLRLKQKVINQMGQLQIMSRKLIQLHLQTSDRIFLGFIYFYGEKISRNSFRQTLNRALDF